MAHELDAAKALRTNAWRTSGARFWAARRLRQRSRLSTFSIAMFSMLVISISVFQIVEVSNATANVTTFVTFITIALSLFVLVISLLEGASNYDVKAQYLQQNAMALGEINKELANVIGQVEDGKAKALRNVPKLRSQYNNLIRECPENHDPIDDDRFRVDHRLSPEFKDANGKPSINAFQAQWIKFKFAWKTAWLYYLSWTSIAILMKWLLFNVLA